VRALLLGRKGGDQAPERRRWVWLAGNNFKDARDALEIPWKRR
jgi:hypothetical protein